MIANLKPYPVMKDSGAPWLGRVPAHWTVHRLGVVLRERGETNEDGRVPDVLSVMRERGVIPYGEKGNVGNKKSDDITRYKIVRPNDIVVNCMNVIIGSVGLSNYTGCLSPVYYVLTRRSQQDNPRYLNAYFQTKPFQQSLVRIGNGILAHRMRIPMELLKCELFPLPPLEEQAAIVRFLDYADRRIRRYIRAKQKLIKLLEEQKQAIIHRAVTRGIDPNVRLKPSGIECLGDVPERWELRKLRQCGAISGGLTPSMADRSLWDGDVPWVTPKDMKRFTIAGASMSVSARALEVTSLRLIPSGSVLLVVRGMILARRVPIARTTEPVTINQDMKAIVPAEGIDAGYLAYRMDAAQATFVPMIDEAGHGTKRFPTERWKDVVFAIPPAGEQRQITRHLDQATEQVAGAVDNAQREIALLHEYRTRLIADVVTGKLDVREAAARLPDETQDTDSLDDFESESVDEEAAADSPEGALEDTEA